MMARKRQTERLRQFSDYPWDYERCLRHASYLIDGKPYCATHAGQVAIEILLQPGN